MSPLLSVIVPVYNTAHYLSKCIDSILRQVKPDIELILIDDGSSDESVAICDYYASRDDRVRVFHMPHKGPIEARRIGIELSSAQYVTFVDSDDFIDDNAYLLLIDYIQQDIDMVCFSISRYYSSAVSRYDQIQFKEGLYSKNDIVNEIYPTLIWDCNKDRPGLDPSLCNKIIKKDILLSCYRNLIDKQFHYGEDMAIIYPAVMNTQSIVIVNKSYYHHRQYKELPKYLINDNFFDNLYQLYKQLCDKCCAEYDFAKQIEYFFIHASALRRKKYRDDKFVPQILFPFGQVDKGDAIVLYGAGNMGKAYMNQITQTKFCKVVLWVDGNYKNLNISDVNSPAKIHTVQYNKIVLAVASPIFIHDILRELALLGINEECIVVPNLPKISMARYHEESESVQIH